MKKIFSIILSAILVITIAGRASDKDKDIDRRVDKLHQKILSVDSHTDTPLRLQQKDFDISKRHDPVRDHSKVDFPRMREGRLDAAFFGVFVSQGRGILMAMQMQSKRQRYYSIQFVPCLPGTRTLPDWPSHRKMPGN